MKPLLALICSGLVLASLPPAALAQGLGGGGARTSSGGINYAPQPAVYEVALVDRAQRTVRLRAADGRTGSVDVPEGVYDLSKLKPGDRIRVDFVPPEGPGGRLRAASIWPAP